jgi:cytochrome c biogenesis protein CcmG, thiol:disulfide interchange protein DsbE
MVSPPKTAAPPERSVPWHYGLVALGVLILLAALPRLALHRHPLVGKPAPDFALDVIHNGEPGAKLQLAKLQGQPVLLAFWATWCGVCRAETPALNRVAERYKDRGLVVVGVDTNDKPGLGAPIAKRLGMVYPIVYDDRDVDDLYGVEALPTLVVVGRDGQVQAVRVGLTDESALDALVSAVLLKRLRSPPGTTAGTSFSPRPTPPSPARLSPARSERRSRPRRQPPCRASAARRDNAARPPPAPRAPRAQPRGAPRSTSAAATRPRHRRPRTLRRTSPRARCEW